VQTLNKKRNVAEITSVPDTTVSASSGEGVTVKENAAYYLDDDEELVDILKDGNCLFACVSHIC
jgi:hypothetical protein